MLTLLGRGPSWTECPFNGEIWATASVLITDGLKDKEYSKVFAFDVPNDGKGLMLKASLEIAKERGIPIVSDHSYATEKFPTIEIIKRFKTSYYKNTMSRMMAYALFTGHKRFQIYGVDQGPGWFYQQGKPFITFWLGVATGMGVKYEIGQHSLRWLYRTGKDGIPQAFLEEESNVEVDKFRLSIR